MFDLDKKFIILFIVISDTNFIRFLYVHPRISVIRLSLLGGEIQLLFSLILTMLPVKIGIIGGSGLDDPDLLENRKEKIVETPYGATSDVLIEGKISGVDCILLARHGRKHSVTPSLINYRANIWALKQEGCTHVIASTATGSLQEHIHPGDLVIMDSFIDR